MMSPLPTNNPNEAAEDEPFPPVSPIRAPDNMEAPWAPPRRRESRLRRIINDIELRVRQQEFEENLENCIEADAEKA